MMKYGICSIMFAAMAFSQPPAVLPWQYRQATAEKVSALSGIAHAPWKAGGGAEGTVSISSEKGPWGDNYLRFTVRVDHHDNSKYPRGWPNIDLPLTPSMDFSGYSAIGYWVRVESDLARDFPLMFIMHTNNKVALNGLLSPAPVSQWRKVYHPFKTIKDLAEITRLHFFISEDSYGHGDTFTFEIGGFELVGALGAPVIMSSIPDVEAAAALWVGSRADTSDEIVIHETGVRLLPMLLRCETGAKQTIRVTDTVTVRFRELFTGTLSQVKMPSGTAIAERSLGRIEKNVALPSLAAGFYVITADIERNGASILGGRVGCDDLYLKAPGESMTYTVLSVRTAMTRYIQDTMGSGMLMHASKMAALPHTYDPFSKETYGEFLRTFAEVSSMQGEGIEAGLTGLFFASEAFYKKGDAVRGKFVDDIIASLTDCMLTKMQAPNGAVLMTLPRGTKDAPPNNGWWNPDQMAEWIRPLTHGMIYYAVERKDAAAASRLSKACRRTVDYIVAHSVESNVIRHFLLSEDVNGAVTRALRFQEGRQCDVYLPRILSGVAHYKYAMQVIGEKVPGRYWEVLDATVDWCAQKMKADGWFDWQCEDIVEGGCHTFLGNMYMGEAFTGCCAANRLAGRTDAAEMAKRNARRAYEYLSGACTIKGRKFDALRMTEFWVGPYLYWLMTEYADATGDTSFSPWLTGLDTQWTVTRKWKDFLLRGGDIAGRAKANGILTTSILGYLGIKQMDELGKPHRYPLPGQ